MLSSGPQPEKKPLKAPQVLSATPAVPSNSADQLSQKTINLDQAQLPAREASLSDQERVAFRPVFDSAVKSCSRIASTLTLPVTALLYFKFGNTEGLPNIEQSAATIASTAVLWYGTYFSTINYWKKQQIELQPKLQEFFTKKSWQATLKIFSAAEVSWFASRIVGDAITIAAVSSVLGASSSANMIGGFTSHLLLSFWLFPKYVMPKLQSFFDEVKSKN